MRVPSWIKWLSFGLVVFITLIGLVLAVENYRGRRAWQKCRAELEAAGENLDWRTFAHPEVPDDQNFAMTPLLAPLQDYTLDPKTHEPVWRNPAAVERTKALFGWQAALDPFRAHSWRKGEFVDLAALQKALRDPGRKFDNPALQALRATPLGDPVQDIRFLLAQNAAELEEIRGATRRPHCRFRGAYEEGMNVFPPPLTVLRNLSRVFAVKALAELKLGHAELAADDVQVCLALGDAAGAEPLLISQLLRLAILDISLQPLWEGMARHQWTDAQLQVFQRRLAAINIPAETVQTLRGERALGLTIIEQLHTDVRAIQAATDEIAPVRWMPSGWLDQNRASLAKLYQDLVINSYDPTNRHIDLKLNSHLIEQERSLFRSKSPYTLFVRQLFPAMAKVAEKAVLTQAAIDQATIACALERHFLAQGEYPATLESLVPRFIDRLPPDPVNQQSFHYRLEARSRFILYSVGLDLKDDQASVALSEKGHPAPRATEGDWVWRSPAG